MLKDSALGATERTDYKYWVLISGPLWLEWMMISGSLWLEWKLIYEDK